MYNQQTESRDKKVKHFRVMKSGEVVRMISRECAAHLFKMKGMGVPVVYAVFGTGTILPMSRSDLYNVVEFGLLVGRTEDIAADYASLLEERAAYMP